jgi:hypothetical protein
MELNFGYVAPYSMFRFVTKVGRSLMCSYLVMIYLSIMLV